MADHLNKPRDIAGHIAQSERARTPPISAATIFVRNNVPVSGALRRNHFFDIRDGDFQRGINHALFNKWITLYHRDRYRYILTDKGYAAGRRAEATARGQG